MYWSNYLCPYIFIAVSLVILLFLPSERKKLYFYCWYLKWFVAMRPYLYGTVRHSNSYQSIACCDAYVCFRPGNNAGFGKSDFTKIQDKGACAKAVCTSNYVCFWSFIFGKGHEFGYSLPEPKAGNEPWSCKRQLLPQTLGLVLR